MTRRGTQHRDGFDNLFSIDDADAFVARSARRPAVRMVRDGVVLDPAAYCTATRIGGQSIAEVIDGMKVAEQVGRGATLVLQSLHRQWDPVVDFADDLMAEIGHPVQINAYLTPSNAAGLRPHSDDHDVLVLQVDGSKQWSVDGLGDVHLRPGDVLYIPAGCEHSAATGGELSLHLTVGILRLTYRSVLDRLLADGPSDLDEPLPLGFHLPRPPADPRALEVGVSRMLTSVVSHLRSVRVADVADRERRRELVPYSRRGQLRSVVELGDLSDDSVVRWVTVAPRMQPLTDESGSPTGRFRLLLADRILQMPHAVGDAIDHIAQARGGVRVSDIPGLDQASRRVIARRLVREGACVVDRG